MARKRGAAPPPALSRETREQLRSLIAAIPAEGDEADPAFLRLLDVWERADVPYGARPLVPAHRCFGGEWVTGGVPGVLAAIKAHCGEITQDERNRTCLFSQYQPPH